LEAVDQDAYQRRIRSYVLRQGRMSDAQRRAYEDGLAHWGIPYSPAPLDLAAAFGRVAPVILEIGFGMGRTTAEIAQAHPQNNYLGVEVHTPGVGSLLKEIQGRGLTNIRIIQHDAVEVLTHMLADTVLAGIHIYFPDPWPKTRHRRRRLIQPSFLEELASKLKRGAHLSIVTDHQEYFALIAACVKRSPLVEVDFARTCAAVETELVGSNFERKYRREGRNLYRLAAEKRL
jgi:tRNA (guanine-N7-)-methyltransferase